MSIRKKIVNGGGERVPPLMSITADQFQAWLRLLVMTGHESGLPYAWSTLAAAPAYSIPNYGCALGRPHLLKAMLKMWQLRTQSVDSMQAMFMGNLLCCCACRL